jgi:hypothetical protein
MMQKIIPAEPTLLQIAAILASALGAVVVAIVGAFLLARAVPAVVLIICGVAGLAFCLVGVLVWVGTIIYERI